MERKSISKRQRFEIFKRDGFTCQYCGQRPPDVVLVIDHINPVAAGGDNDILNLITSCEACNQGKSDKKLGDIHPRPDADLEWLEMQQEVVELRRFQLAKSERDILLNKVIEQLQDTWALHFDDKWVPTHSELAQWMTWANPEEIEDSIKLTASKAFAIRSFDARLRYVAGTLHNIVKARDINNG